MIDDKFGTFIKKFKETKIIKSENVVFFDCDDTLIIGAGPGKKIEILDPTGGPDISTFAHEPNIRLLLEEKARGSFVIVWSRGGYQWANNILTALGLMDRVDLVMSKPLVYFDDTPIEKWLPYRVWLEPNMNYKK